jgi:hypothetical protein
MGKRKRIVIDMTDAANSTIRLRLRPTHTPRISWHCQACGQRREFQCAEKFRLNSNQRKVDVWLLYRCEKCSNTVNVEVYERKDPRTFAGDEFTRLLQNDAQLAWDYAFDFVMLKARSIRVDKKVDFEIVGDSLLKSIADAPSVTLEIIPQYPIELRIDRLFSRLTGLSRNKINQLLALDHISIEARLAGSKSVLLQTPVKAVLRSQALQEIKDISLST